MHEIGLCWPEIFKTSEQNNIHDPGRNFRENFVCQTLFLAQYLRLIFPLRNGAAGVQRPEKSLHLKSVNYEKREID
jgi:hypothetical protein